MSFAGMCWWLTFIKTFICASYAAITGRGCSWSKSICHMSKISVHRFTGRLLRLAVYSTITAFPNWRALLDKRWKTSCFSSCWFYLSSSFGWRRLQLCTTQSCHRLTQHWRHGRVTSCWSVPFRIMGTLIRIKSGVMQKDSWCYFSLCN